MDATPPPPQSPQNPPELPSPPPGSPNPNATAQQFIVGLHLCPLVGMVLPFGNLLAPLILWLIKRPESPAIDAVGKDVLNFQLSITLYVFVSILLCLLLIGFLLLFGLFIFWIYAMIIAAAKAGNGESYTYPLTIRFLN